MSGWWEEACNLIIRPERCKYRAQDLGPRMFSIKGRPCRRSDLVLVNERGLRLQCSYFEPIEREPRLPCVVYAHGNCGSRCDALEAACLLLPHNICVMGLDFAGSGHSEGDFVSLGFFEKDDLRTVVTHLRSDGKTSHIGLWGRSMGAASSLMYAATDPNIAAMVVDSPFTSITDIVMDLANMHKIPKLGVSAPRFLVSLTLKLVRRSILARAGFDLCAVSPLESSPKCVVPVLFAHANSDTLVPQLHSDDGRQQQQ